MKAGCRLTEEQPGVGESAGVEPYLMVPFGIAVHTSRYQLDRLAIFPTTMNGAYSPGVYSLAPFW